MVVSSTVFFCRLTGFSGEILQAIRYEERTKDVFRELGRNISLAVCVSKPSHDWAASELLTDFTINANGTLVMLEATRDYRATLRTWFRSLIQPALEPRLAA